MSTISSLGTALVWAPSRVFVSPALGCPAYCRFCYLGSVGLQRPQKPRLGPEALLERIVKDDRFRPGPSGTVISLGCLSECLAPHSLPDTFEFLHAIRSLQNPVQLATRWTLDGGEFAMFENEFKAVSGILFHSMTETGPKRLELGTPPWNERRRFMAAIAASGIPSVMYIKPFLPGYTSRFAADFIALARRLTIQHAVVGPVFSDSRIDVVLRSAGVTLARDSTYAQANFPVCDQPPQDSDATPEVEEFRARLVHGGLAVFSHSLESLGVLMRLMRRDQNTRLQSVKGLPIARRLGAEHEGTKQKD